MFIIGLILMILGIVHIISYLNLLTVGYSFNEYVNYIIKHFYFLYTILGILIITLSIYIKGGKDELSI